jgi:transaldolase
LTRKYNYFKKYGHKTEVMGASFRNIGEIEELAGCDLLTISPQLLAELEQKTGTLARKLDPAKAKSMSIEKIEMDEATFRAMHEKDSMAKDKLAEGIEGFSKALVALEKYLAERLDRVIGEARGSAARNLFTVYDLDGDGFITREEWGGAEAVFDALDNDHDGRITPEEMAAGLGAAFRLTS